jgi:hypothetical protein
MTTEQLHEITEARLKAIESSIEPISTEQLKQLVEGLFSYPDHPWQAKISGFIAENNDATFYHAKAGPQLHVLYCPEKERGIWFLLGRAMGPIQPGTLAALKKMVKP